MKSTAIDNQAGNASIQYLSGKKSSIPYLMIIR